MPLLSLGLQVRTGTINLVGPGILCSIGCTTRVPGPCFDVSVQQVQSLPDTCKHPSLSDSLHFTSPLGHMASHDHAESGSYFNNAAVAARAAQAAGAARVLIVDWDVHHAKGTQSIFEDDASVTVVSLHRLDE